MKFRLLRQYNEVNRLTGIRPNPDIGGGRYFSSDQDTVYYSWQSSLRKRYSKGLTGSVHYTWGKALSYSGGDTGAGFSGDTFSAIQDFFDRRANRGPSAGDVTHRLVAESVYETPQLAGASSVLRHLAGSWQCPECSPGPAASLCLSHKARPSRPAVPIMWAAMPSWKITARPCSS
ncbi:MAG: hypothetical protein ACRD44_14880 [Bryobacteraceae bacterium]